MCDSPLFHSGTEFDALNWIARKTKWVIPELLANVTYSVIPAKAGIQNCLKTLDSGSRFACPE
jgi:hypothetical protein